jgi:hypothetical protein
MVVWFVGAAKAFVVLQTSGAIITGTIADAASGTPIAGAEIALPDLGRVVTSDAGGRYAIRDVPPGPQHVSVRRIGFAPRVLHAIVPRLGEVAIDITLERAPVRLRAVDVHPTLPIRGVERAEASGPMDRSVSLAAMRNHPLLFEPDAFLAATGGNIVAALETPSGMHVRGGAADQTAFLLDGIPVLNPYHAVGTFSAWNPDALDGLTVSPPSPALPDADALSGVVTAVTRPPGERLAAQGAISTTQARVTLDGPLGLANAGFLLSARSGFPGFIAPKREPSYVGGHTRDGMVKVVLPIFGGSARVLGYESANRLDAAATARDSMAPFDRRNTFGWNGRSIGAEWSRALGHSSLMLRGWRATSDADAVWNPNGVAGAGARMSADRRDDGLTLAIDQTGGTTSALGVQLRRTTTFYRVRSANSRAAPYALTSRAPVVTVYGRHERALGDRLRGTGAVSASSVEGKAYLRSYAEIGWMPSASLRLSGAYVHGHQFAQTLRNSESIVGAIFPVDLFAGVGAVGIPVARSDDGLLAAEYRPVDGVRVGAQLYRRSMGGLVLVAPRTSDPFPATDPATGAGTATGLSLEAGISSARYGFVATYGWQRGRLEHADSSYVPAYVTTHLLEAGVIVFPSATSSIRVGVTGAAGRRATALSGAFEWETCNLLDRGCEFGGSPRTATSLGEARPPRYLRLDLGARKHWHVRAGRHDTLVAVFGGVTNVLGRPNVLTFTTDPATGEPTPIGMRPLAPLVVGLDWRF